MPYNKLSPPSIQHLYQGMNQLAREIGATDLNPRCVKLIDEMSALSLISAEMNPKG